MHAPDFPLEQRTIGHVLAEKARRIPDRPLLRWQGFAPRASGIRAMLPHVDAFRAGHSIASLAGLAAAISDPGDRGELARMTRLMAK